ncbi:MULTISPECIES: Tox-REase-5 domain-containing protein [Enterobacter cloacae complex]|uniref:Tox-REase-5 domain-containing protein n=2 Tax=Enterobacter cloacae complex TaxID=354276 RepID=UPI00097C2E90|nr:Tox-REase-5 domain-containing protein [Enterobacter chengduensis]GJL42779.1 hypothetical protein TUM17577_39880 [Enterobacter asburiae]MCK7170819.1 restriction endonuclease fold toxin 5 domain-containing protein [Enterobacter chengduensis]MCM8032957.1 restriction endonuclease fold toxin 5 domain-containing protein [Enterobacter chengduensis]MCW5063857.1 restriction endonuclease fold toxin 5 domain-containing protein [Enterobacter chengduensis]MDI6557908.1 Tox-REase-5 domain-containing prote
MVMFPINPTGMAGMAGAAGGAIGASSYPGAQRAPAPWDSDDGSWGASRSQSPYSGFTWQGKRYDPILNQPMEVSAEMHGNYWEDDMDYSESVTYEDVGCKTTITAKSKSCLACPPDGKVAPMVRRCSRWSEVTISYQTRICGTYYNPETKQIQEFKYCGVSFDGWKEALCQFWEAKARYDQFFDVFGDPKGWWKGFKSGLSQAARHQAVATVNQPLKVVWVFMQPVSYRYFSKMFKDFKDIITRWVP